MHYLTKSFVALAVVFSLLTVQTAFAKQINTTWAQVTQQNVPQGSASLNWSGYVAQQNDSQYTSITGSWVIPTVATPSTSQGQADATWVGIGGVESNDLIQAGTQAIVENGSITYNAWYETLPSFAQTVNLSVAPGDSMTTTLTNQGGNTWSITIRDNTTGQQYSTQVTYASSLSSAEWVEEMVSNGNGSFRPLDSFGSVSFTGGSAVVNGQTEDIQASGAQSLQMINRAGQALATASALGSDGASFSVARTSASATAASTSTGRWHVVSTATSTGGQPQSIPTTSRHTRRGGGFGFGGFGSFNGSSLGGFGLPQEVTQFLNQAQSQSYNQPTQSSSSSNGNVQTYQVGGWTIQVIGL